MARRDTDRLLDFAHAGHPLPPVAAEAARRLLGDTLAVAAAGSNAPGAAGVRAAASGWGASGESRVIARGGYLPASAAAFVNAFQSHCLEWDAVHEHAVVHALSVVTAVLHAAIDRRGGCASDEALAALAVGVDVASGLGIAADSGLGFFRPATAGLVGAALAAARIEGLPRARFDDVLGLAVAQCAGTMQAHVEGSIALPLQIAAAARAAISAVDLVCAGLTGPHDAIEGPFGYFPLFDRGTLATYTRDVGRIWRIAEVSTKPYPSGRASHAMLAALDELRRGREVDADRIERIEAFVPPLIARLVGRVPAPDMTPAYARLCLPLLAALMLEDGIVDPRRFLPAVFADPAIRALAARIVLIVDDNPDPNALSPQRLVVTRTDGSRIERTIPHTLGHPEAPMSARQTAVKTSLARTLAGEVPDPRLFNDPVDYLVRPAP